MTSSGNPDADRAARNEALFRRVNERVEEVSQAFEEILDTADFFCECAEIGCMEKIRMKIAEYEQLRAESTHFAVKPGHEVPQTERVVARRTGYLVVEKIGQAGERADELDPRE
jgi:hypothetical protein